MASKLVSLASYCMLGILVFTLAGCGSGCSCGCCGDKSKDVEKKGEPVRSGVIESGIMESEAAKNEDKCCCECCSKCCSENTVVEDKIMTDVGSRQKSDTGLEWEIIKAGEGMSPKAGQTVVVHYTGWINENGTIGRKFDSSVDRGQKFEFTIGVGQVIPGWDEGVILMKKGEKRRLYIPSKLAYGSRGAGAIIKPNSDLIFDVELFDMY